LTRSGRLSIRIEARYLDRRAIERLFGVKRRRAQQMMTRLVPAVEIGTNVVVERAELMVALEALARGDRMATFRARRRRAAEEIAEAQEQAAAREVEVPGVPLRRTLESLPATISLRPGRLDIRFKSVSDLWRQLSELASAAAADRDRFREAAEPEANV
jgi:hypothetical protein